MKRDVFEEKIKPTLNYVGIIGATLTSAAYVIVVIVLIKGFEYRAPTQALYFAIINAIIGLVIMGFLKYQGISFAKELPENLVISNEYYATRTKDKKNHNLTYYWITTTIKDIVTKGISIAVTTTGLIYIVIVGSNDWNLLLLAIVNLILFICFGLLSLSKSYDFYNNIFVNYMKEKIKENKECSNSTEKNTEA